MNLICIISGVLCQFMASGCTLRVLSIFQGVPIHTVLYFSELPLTIPFLLGVYPLMVPTITSTHPSILSTTHLPCSLLPLPHVSLLKQQNGVRKVSLLQKRAQFYSIYIFLHHLIIYPRISVENHISNACFTTFNLLISF